MPRQRHPITGCRADTLVNQVWLIDYEWLNAAVSDPRAQDLTVLMKLNEDRRDEDQDPPYVVKDHVAVVPIQGPMTKYPTSFQALFGGASYTELRKTYRDLAKDDSVRVVLQQIESPGGSAAGLPETITDLVKLREKKKVITQFEDHGTSAAYGLGIHANEVVGNSMARVANIGTMTKVIDTSKMENMKGVRVIPIYPDGYDFKALGMPGVEVTPEAKAEMQRQVKDYNDHFVGWVSKARGLTEQQIRDFKARVYMGEQAKQLKLIDDVRSFDETLDRAISEANNKTTVVVPGTPTPSNPPGQAGAPARSKAMPLTAEQIAKLQSAGVKDVTAENAETKMYDAVVNYHGLVTQRDQTIQQKDIEINSLKTAKPQQQTEMTPAMLEERCGVVLERIDLLAEQTYITGDQATKFKAMVKGEDGKINAAMLTPTANGKAPIAMMLDAVKGNKPNGLNKEQSPGQPVTNPNNGNNGGANGPMNFATAADAVVKAQQAQIYDVRRHSAGATTPA